MNVAVLMPYKNSAKTIRETLDSINSQTHRSFKLFLVNNSSTDLSESIVKNYFYRKDISVEHLIGNGNFACGLNLGLIEILASKAPVFDVVARMDSDDVWLPTKLEKQISFLEKNPDVAILGTQMVCFTTDQNICYEYPYYPHDDAGIREMMFNQRNPIGHPTAMIRREVFLRSGVYDDIYRHCEDYQYWIKASRHFKLANLPEVLIKYRIHHNPEYDPSIPVVCRDLYGKAITNAR